MEIDSNLCRFSTWGMNLLSAEGLTWRKHRRVAGSSFGTELSDLSLMDLDLDSPPYTQIQISLEEDSRNLPGHGANGRMERQGFYRHSGHTKNHCQGIYASTLQSSPYILAVRFPRDQCLRVRISFYLVRNQLWERTPTNGIKGNPTSCRRQHVGTRGTQHCL